jgi:hypothetical protein
MDRTRIDGEQERRRSILVATLMCVGFLAFLVGGTYAVYRHKPRTNQLTGMVVEKYKLDEVVREVQVGRRGLRSEEVDSGHRFQVWVESTGKTYEVPVTARMFDLKEIGDLQSFIKPPSEQR